MKDICLFKIGNPNSKHNQKLIRDNHYQHGKNICESENIFKLEDKLQEAGF